MATGERSGPDDLSHFDRLVNNPDAHHIFHAMRVLEASFPDAPRFGESVRPREDLVRFGQEAELAFPPNTIADFKPSKGGKPARLTNRFFGLFGPQGPLPLHMTEYARDRLRNHRDPTLVAFANMLTHRMLSLLYRAWSTGEPAPSFDRNKDPVGRNIAAFSGLRGDHLRDRDAMPDLAKLHFTGHLSQGTKTAEGLTSILSAFFDVPVRIQEFVGSWLDLEPDDQWQLGGPAGLGRSTSIGQKVWTRSAKFRLSVGPLSMTAYERLLPGGASLNRLRAIVRNYIGDTLDWDVNLVLAGDEVPRASLGGTTRLGHTSWIASPDADDEPRPDAADLFVYPQALGATA